MIAAAIIACAVVAVVDGDTFRCDGAAVRIATIDAPELHSAKCDAERRLAELARDRLAAILGAGDVTVSVGDPSDGRTTDRHGRVLGVAMADGVDAGDVMVRERLARPWEGKRRPWCD